MAPRNKNNKNNKSTGNKKPASDADKRRVINNLAKSGNQAAANYLSSLNKGGNKTTTTSTQTKTTTTAPKGPTLPSAGSVVDYLNSTKKDSSFGARSKLYEQAGLSKTLGAYTGGGNQNTALLNHLKGQNKPASTPNLAGIGGTSSLYGRTTTPTNANQQWAANAASGYLASQSTQANTSNQSQGIFGRAFDFLKSSAKGDYFKTPAELAADQKYVTTLTGKPYTLNPSQDAKVTSLTSRYIPPTENATSTGTTISQNGRSVTAFDSNLGEPQYSPIGGIGSKANGYTFTQNGWVRDTTQPTGNVIAAQRGPGETIPDTGEPQYSPIGGIGSKANGYTFTRDGWVKDTTQQTPSYQPPRQASNPPDETGQNPFGQNDQVNDDGTVTTEEGETMTEEDWIKRYLDTTQGKLESAKAEIDRDETKADREREIHNFRRTAEEDKERISRAFESRGLSMSGMKFEDLEDIEEELLYDLMDVDKTYGRRLLREDIAFQEVVIGGVAELMKAAEEDNDAAMETLKDMGYVYFNGELVPTLERERMVWGQNMDAARYNLSSSYYDLAVQKFLDDRGGGGGGADEYALLGWLADNEDASLLDAESWAGRNTSLKDTDVGDIFYNRPLEPGADAQKLAYNMMYNMVDSTDWESGYIFNWDEAGDIEDYMREQFESNLTSDSLDAPVGERSAWLPTVRGGEVVNIQVPELSFEDAVSYARTEWKELEAKVREELEK